MRRHGVCGLAVGTVLAVLPQSTAHGQTPLLFGQRQGGWSDDPTWRQFQVWFLVTVLAVALVTVIVNVILKTRDRRWSSVLEKKAAPDLNVQAVLNARAPALARGSGSQSRPSPLPFVPPLESADPLWDRDLDQRGN